MPAGSIAVMRASWFGLREIFVEMAVGAAVVLVVVAVAVVVVVVDVLEDGRPWSLPLFPCVVVPLAP
jgi:hypothetical protein